MTVNNLPPRSSQAAFQLLFFLRFIQLGSTVITGFIACYFIWWHNVINDDVPEGLKIILFAVRLPLFRSMNN
jgi:fructose-specific phosphotransferase system IIC component